MAVAAAAVTTPRAAECFIFSVVQSIEIAYRGVAVVAADPHAVGVALRYHAAYEFVLVGIDDRREVAAEACTLRESTHPCSRSKDVFVNWRRQRYIVSRRREWEQAKGVGVT